MLRANGHLERCFCSSSSTISIYTFESPYRHTRNDSLMLVLHNSVHVHAYIRRRCTTWWHACTKGVQFMGVDMHGRTRVTQIQPISLNPSTSFFFPASCKSLFGTTLLHKCQSRIGIIISQLISQLALCTRDKCTIKISLIYIYILYTQCIKLCCCD